MIPAARRRLRQEENTGSVRGTVLKGSGVCRRSPPQTARRMAPEIEVNICTMNSAPSNGMSASGAVNRRPRTTPGLSLPMLSSRLYVAENAASTPGHVITASPRC